MLHGCWVGGNGRFREPCCPGVARCFPRENRRRVGGVHIELSLLGLWLWEAESEPGGDAQDEHDTDTHLVRVLQQELPAVLVTGMIE